MSRFKFVASLFLSALWLLIGLGLAIQGSIELGTREAGSVERNEAFNDVVKGSLLTILGVVFLTTKVGPILLRPRYRFPRLNLAYRKRRGWRSERNTDPKSTLLLTLLHEARGLECYLFAAASSGPRITSSDSAANGRGELIKEDNESHRETSRFSEPFGRGEATWVEYEATHEGKEAGIVVVGYGHRGFHLEVSLFGPIAEMRDGRGLAVMRDEILPGLAILDPDRASFSLLAPAGDEYVSSSFGYRFQSSSGGWRQWPRAVLEDEDAELGLFHDDGGILTLHPFVVPDGELAFDGICRGALGFFGFSYPSAELKSLGRGGDGAAPWAAFAATRNSGDNAYEFRLLVLRWKEAGCLLTYVTEPGNPTIDERFDEVRAGFTAPPASFRTPPLTELLGKPRARQVNFLQQVASWYFDQREYGAAARTQRLLFDLEQDSADRLAQLMRAHSAGGEFERAYELYREHGARFTEHLQLRSFEPFLLRRMGRLQESRIRFEEVFDAGWRDLADLRDYLELLAELKEDAAGLTRVQAWMEEIKNPELHEMLARIHRAMGAHDEAIGTLKSLLESEPQNVRILTSLAHEYSHAERYDDAIRVCDDLADRGHQGASIAFARGVAEYHLKWYPQARRSFEAAMAEEPANDHFRSWLDHVTDQMGQGNTRMIRQPIEPIEFAGPGTPSAEEIDAFPDSGAVYLEASGVLRVQEGQGQLRTNRVRILMRTAEGVRRYSTFQIPFEPEGERLFINDVRVLDGGGSTVSVGGLEDCFIKDKEGSEGSTSKVVHVPIHGLTPDSVLEVTWTTRPHGVSTKVPFTRESFGRESPVLRAQFEIRGDVDDLCVELVGPVTQERGEGRHRFEARGITDSRRMPYSVRGSRWLPAVWFGVPEGSWAEITERYLESIEHRLRPRPAVEELARRITEGADSIPEKASRIAAFVRRELSYKAIEFGPRGRVPNDVEDVLKARFGDCKDHSLLFLHLMRGAGGSCELALVDSAEDACPAIPSQGQFNHMINYCPDLYGGRFIDCVDKEQSMETSVPYGLEERDALVLDQANPRLVSIPSVPDDQEQLAVERRIRAANRTDLEVEEVLTLQGYYAAFFRRYLRHAESTMHDRLQGLLAGYDARIQLTEHRLEHLDEFDRPFEVHLRYLVQEASEEIKGRQSAVVPTHWERAYIIPSAVPGRTSPFEIDGPLHYKGSVALEGLSLAATPAPESANLSEEDAFVRWSHRTTQGEQGPELVLDYHSKRGRHPSMDYSQFRESSIRAARSLETRFLWSDAPC